MPGLRGETEPGGCEVRKETTTQVFALKDMQLICASFKGFVGVAEPGVAVPDERRRRAVFDSGGGADLEEFNRSGTKRQKIGRIQFIKALRFSAQLKLSRERKGEN